MLDGPRTLCSVHTGLLMLLYPFVPETPYWLVHQGDVAGADAVLHKMAQVNGVSLPKVTLPPTTPLLYPVFSRTLGMLFWHLD